VKRRLLASSLILMLATAGAWVLQPPARQSLAAEVVSSPRINLIDCTRGVACPIIWHPPIKQAPSGK